MSKRAFIRAFWGIPKKEESMSHFFAHASMVNNDIKLAMISPYSPKIEESMVYVFGEDNYKMISDLGFRCALVDKKPYVFDMEKEHYRHKIEVWKCGLQDFDEVCFMDFDQIAFAPIPSDFWDKQSKGAPIRCSLIRYLRPKVPERGRGCQRFTSTSSLVYIRGVEHANGIIKKWENTGRKWYEEPALSLYIDEINGGWKGVQDYYSKFESEYATWNVYGHTSDYIKNSMIPNVVTMHLKKRFTARLLGNGEKDGVIERINQWYKNMRTNFEKYYEQTLEKEKTEKPA